MKTSAEITKSSDGFSRVRYIDSDESGQHYCFREYVTLESVEEIKAYVLETYGPEVSVLDKTNS